MSIDETIKKIRQELGGLNGALGLAVILAESAKNKELDTALRDARNHMLKVSGLLNGDEQ